MFIEVTQRTEAPNTNAKTTDATTVTPAVVDSIMGVVTLIMGVVIVVLIRNNRLYFYILFHS